VRQQSLGRSVVCTHCAAAFVAEEPELSVKEPISYGPGGNRSWQGLVGLILLFVFAAVAVWILALRS
jgi:hypothetical protein